MKIQITSFKKTIDKIDIPLTTLISEKYHIREKWQIYVKYIPNL